jgi:prepilin-type N-terminal cleavage/methylation domain-containing protein
MNLRKKTDKSFTLIEILVVIVIIGVISTLVIVGMNSISSKARIAKAQTFINSVDNSLLLARVSQWRFDELATAKDTNTTVDYWNTNTATLSTGDALEKIKTDCPSDKCLYFDGIDDYVQINGSNVATSNLAITGAITLSAWVKFSVAGTDQSIAGRGEGMGVAGNYGYFLSRYSGNNLIIFDTYSTTPTRDSLDSVSPIADTNWHFIVATWDGTINTNGKKIYIDGVFDNQKTSTISAIGQPNYYFRIGRESTSGWYPFGGSIDDVRVYNQAIPISEIQQNYFIGLNNLYKNNGITLNEFNQRIGELRSNLSKD